MKTADANATGIRKVVVRVIRTGGVVTLEPVVSYAGGRVEVLPQKTLDEGDDLQITFDETARQ